MLCNLRMYAFNSKYTIHMENLFQTNPSGWQKEISPTEVDWYLCSFIDILYYSMPDSFISEFMQVMKPHLFSVCMDEKVGIIAGMQGFKTSKETFFCKLSLSVLFTFSWCHSPQPLRLFFATILSYFIEEKKLQIKIYYTKFLLVILPNIILFFCDHF